ncbi:NAD-dependent epimerase/dehydratase family protein [Marinicella sp. W31]|uniref:NAD-dependent epimerase/dehydratase family protein n=1 Tax=Marinicella sp. W31 TaxID=3023713 RepID=UPI0037565707
MMKVLVTGSAGHLGEALMRTFAAQQVTAVGVDVKQSEYTTAVGSIANRDFVEAQMQGITHVYHTATLHKPHVATHTRQDFIDTNITGTLNLLESAHRQQVKSFVFTSTTSVFGDAMRPSTSQPAAWVTEETRPIPKNIYGATKTAAEDLCQLFHRNQGMNCIVLRTSRFFPEDDDDKNKREAFTSKNLKANEFLFRRADISDIVSAHLVAAAKAPEIGFGRYIISATTPFREQDLLELRNAAPSVLARYMPEYEAIYANLGWQMFAGIDRVYVNEKARKELQWQPQYDFKHWLNCLQQGTEPNSSMVKTIGQKGYHETVFTEGPYPVE